MNTVEVELVEPSNAVALRDKAEAPAKTERKAPTAQELRVTEVSEALLPAYQRAATLELTDAEIEAIMAPFPDEIIEIRPHDGLIFIPHIHISKRLNTVIKPGKWALVCRRHWLEGNTMYGEYVLVIRGCYVGESVGGHPYQPNNPKVNYSDTLESTAAEALRRIAGKRLSCGSQVWEPEYSRQWVAKYAHQTNGKWQKRTAASAATPAKTVSPAFSEKKAPETPPANKNAPNVKSERLEATPEQKAKMIATIEAEGPDAVQKALGYFIESGALLPSESLSDLPLHWVPATQNQFRELGLLIAKLNDTGQATKPAWVVNLPKDPPAPANPATSFNAEEDENPFNEQEQPKSAPQQAKSEPQQGLEQPEFNDETWRSYITPWGKHAGVRLDKLPKNTLWGFWKNHTVETEFKGKPIAPEKIAKAQEFRDMLDASGRHYQFTDT